MYTWTTGIKYYFHTATKKNIFPSYHIYIKIRKRKHPNRLLVVKRGNRKPRVGTRSPHWLAKNSRSAEKVICTDREVSISRWRKTKKYLWLTRWWTENLSTSSFSGYFLHHLRSTSPCVMYKRISSPRMEWYNVWFPADILGFYCEQVAIIDFLKVFLHLSF